MRAAVRSVVAGVSPLCFLSVSGHVDRALDVSSSSSMGMFERVAEAGSGRPSNRGQPRSAPSGAKAHVWYGV